MRRIQILLSALILCSSAVFSQGQLDAYKYSQTDLSGTARYLSMGGAFGALGGDISVMGNNPAGLGVYRSSEIVTSLSLNSVSAESNFMGNKLSNDRTRLYFDNIAYINYFPTSNDEGLVGWTVGFSYNRLKNFQRNYSMRGVQEYSLSDYMAVRACGIDRSWLEFPAEGSGDTYNPYNSDEVGDWLSVLGYDVAAFDITEKPGVYASTFGDIGGDLYPITNSELHVTERGAIDQYNIAFGMNISNIVMLGASAIITDFNYHYHSFYAEDFDHNFFELENWLDTEGTGYAFNIGAIVCPVDFLRLGVAYNSPTWYKFTDYFDANAITNSDSNNPVQMERSTPSGYFEYDYRTHDRWIFSAAAILGQTALLSVDYELLNYKNMKFQDRHDFNDFFTDTNADIRRNFGTTGNLKIGAEVKVTPQFAVRAGAAWFGNPMKSALKDATEEVHTVGTVPHYLIENSISNYTVGFGYRFTPHFYMDLACVLKHQKEDLYAFSNISKEGADGTPYSVESQKISLKTNTTRVALTLGYKF